VFIRNMKPATIRRLSKIVTGFLLVAWFVNIKTTIHWCNVPEGGVRPTLDIYGGGVFFNA
jgi:hypothetical protein